MIAKGTEKLYQDFLNTKSSRWEFGNSILYEMCSNNPYHNQSDIIVGKIWIIGRSYAAAIERRKHASNTNDDFYYDLVAPKMLEIGDELDERLSQLRDDGGTIRDNVKNILETHKFLMDVFYELTGLEKRSLASKYLHFHCPELFFIYDSRARTAINRYVKRPDKKALDNINCDKEYGDFVCRMLELQAFLQERTDCNQSPRTLDSFLLQKGL